MRFLCPLCNFTVRVADDAYSKRVQCPNCNQSIVTPASDFEPGCVVGDFVIQTKLGEGSIGAVYKARQISLDRTVALKILSKRHMSKHGSIEFLREARAAAKLTHTNLVQSYAVGVESDYCYMAMTYITGETLKSRIIREGRIPVDEALHIVQQVAEALHYAWTEQKLIHRDVKPDNIMLSTHGVVKLTDLGLAMSQADWTENMDISGSPSYMSPEQFGGEKLDTRSDIYSLGITLYQMLSGRLPFDAETVRSVAKQHFEMNPPDLAKLVPDLPPDVNRCVKKMMAKMPAKRFKDMDDLLHAIWKIRQHTAPRKDFVPDVHTISMRRLDYSFQEIPGITEEKKTSIPPATASQQISQSPAKGTGAVAYALLGVLLVLMLGVGALVLLKMPRGDSETIYYATLDREISNLEILVDDESLPREEKAVEAARIVQKIESHDRNGVRDRAMLNYVKALLTPQSDTEKVPLAQLTEAQKALVQAQQERDAALENARQLQLGINSKESEFKSDRDRLENDIKYWQGQVESLQKSLADEQGKSNVFLQQYYGFIQDYLAASFCQNWKKRNFAAVKTLMAETEKVMPKYSLWFTEINEINQLCEKLSEILPTGKEELGAVTVDDLLKLVADKSDTFPLETRNKAALELIRGNLGAVCKHAPEDTTLLQLVDGCCRYEAFLLQNALLSQPAAKRSKEKLDEFKRIFEGTPSYPKLYEKLVALLPENADPALFVKPEQE